jgi:hypothetical protein
VAVSYIQRTSCSLIWISRVATTMTILATTLPPALRRVIFRLQIQINRQQTDIDVGYQDITYEPYQLPDDPNLECTGSMGINPLGRRTKSLLSAILLTGYQGIMLPKLSSIRPILYLIQIKSCGWLLAGRRAIPLAAPGVRT